MIELEESQSELDEKYAYCGSLFIVESVLIDKPVLSLSSAGCLLLKLINNFLQIFATQIDIIVFLILNCL